MTNSAKFRIGLILFGLLCTIAGAWLLVGVVGWWGILGLMLLLMSNNITAFVQRGQDLETMNQRAQLIEVIERFEERQNPTSHSQEKPDTEEMVTVIIPLVTTKGGHQA